MTSRQRVLAAIEHRTPDQVPVDLGSTPSSGISAVACNELEKHMGGTEPDEVRQHVLQRLETFAPGGGFVFNTIHNILPEVPPQNVVALFEAVREFNGRS